MIRHGEEKFGWVHLANWNFQLSLLTSKPAAAMSFGISVTAARS
jgi:hypothetical protein